MIPVYEPYLQNDVLQSAVDKVIADEWIGPGPKTEELERKICELTDKKYCVAVNSGTSALYIAALYLKHKYKNKLFSSHVIVPGYGYVAATNACVMAGMNTFPVDVSLNTCCISPEALEERLSYTYGANISGVFFINHNGYSGPDYIEIAKLCDQYKVHLISDSAVSIGNNFAGSLGLCGIYSFSVPKLITTGQGGCLFTDDKSLYIFAKQIRDQGDNWRTDRNHKQIGMNLRMPDLLSSIGVAQLEKLPTLLKIRKKLWNLYRTYLKPNLLVETGNESNWCVIIRTPNAYEIINRLATIGVKAQQFYLALHNNAAYKDILSSYRGHLPNSETLERELVYLPSSLNLRPEQVRQICQVVNEYA